MKIENFKNILVAALLLSLLSLVAASPLLSPGWYQSHEGNTIVERVVAIAYEIRGGDWYPRWLSMANLGKGVPFLNFYPPGFYLTAGYLHAFGVPVLLAIKSICVALFALGAWGMFLWLREHYGVTGALLAAILYLFVPYHFVDIYVRGAMAEFTALAFFPFLFYGIDLSYSPGRLRAGMAVTAGATASIILTHYLSALMIAPFALIYFLRAAYISRPAGRQLLAATVAPLIGVGLSAFYWLPVMGERGYLNEFEARVTDGYFAYTNHFVYPAQWFSTFWGFRYSLPGPNDQMSFQIGTVLLLFVGAALVSLCIGKTGERGFAVILTLLGMGALFFTITASVPVYELLPVYRFVQFPWRFLGPATFFLAASAGHLGSPRGINRHPLVPALLIVTVVLLSISFSTRQRSVEMRFPEDYDQIAQSLIQKRQVSKLTERNDYLPRWVDYEMVSFINLPAGPLAPTARIDGLQIGASRMTFSATSNQKLSLVTVRWFYFPGWQLRVDGEARPVRPGPNGFINFDLPAGTHKVELSFGTTTIRLAGWCLSGATLAVMLAWWGMTIASQSRKRGEQ